MKRFLQVIILIVLQTFFSNVFADGDSVKFDLKSGYFTSDQKSIIEKNVSDLLGVLNKSYKSEGDTIKKENLQISEEALDNINLIWSSSKFYLRDNMISEVLIKTSKGYELRNIPVVMNNDTLEIAIDINNNGAIEDIFFPVKIQQYGKDVFDNSVINETKKNVIRDFLEAFRTAYMRKDISFISNVFSDKALIIVGRKIEKSDQSCLQVNTSEKKSLYTGGSSTLYKKMTKDEYIDNLKNVFKVNKSINIDFRDIEIFRHRKSGYESYYGVRLKQKWVSDRYEDYGLLFFVIQFRENDYPIIWVRVWQDAKTSDNEKIGLGDIQISPM